METWIIDNISMRVKKWTEKQELVTYQHVFNLDHKTIWVIATSSVHGFRQHPLSGLISSDNSHLPEPAEKSVPDSLFNQQNV